MTLIDPPGRQGPGPLAHDAITRLDLRIARRAGGPLPGERRAPGVGTGTELAQLYDELGAASVGRTLAELQHQLRQVANPEVIAVEDFLGYQLDNGPVPENLRAAARRDLARLTSYSTRVSGPCITFAS